MKALSRWLVPAAGAALAACASTGITVDYDRSVAFSAYRTYAWVDSAAAKRERADGPFFERRARRAVERALRERGLAPAGDAAPDLFVTAFLIGPTEEERGWRTWPAAPCGPVVSIGFGFGYPWGYGRRHEPWLWSSPWYRSPWGYACGYRVGYGYFWVPVYEEPGRRLGGTFVIEIVDATTHQLVWRGSEEGVVRSIGESVTQEELDRLADEILKHFPPTGDQARP
ncbi:MAG TPA: DUF4136 domain-containing protein [Gemmatimonadales bacterium]|nr:DUF4136 domain-containing protein [Gemmatimonadales bacterium]